MLTYTSYINRFQDYTGNTLTTNNTRALQWVNDSLRYLTTKYFFNEATFTVPGGSIAQTQNYQLPYDIKRIINVTIKVGGFLYQPIESPNRQHWDSINMVPFYSDFPQFFYRYPFATVGIFPTPTTSSNAITINYQRRIVDISQADYITGTVSVTTLTTTVTGAGGASWTTSMAGRWIQIAMNSTSNATSGDNAWYQIASVTNGTTLVLNNQYQGATVSGGTYIIGETPLLPEDYQDLPLYRALSIYYSTLVHNKEEAELNKRLYEEGFAKLDAEFGSKSTNPVLTPPNSPVYNPNSFPRNLTQA